MQRKSAITVVGYRTVEGDVEYMEMDVALEEDDTDERFLAFEVQRTGWHRSCPPPPPPLFSNWGSIPPLTPMRCPIPSLIPPDLYFLLPAAGQR